MPYYIQTFNVQNYKETKKRKENVNFLLKKSEVSHFDSWKRDEVGKGCSQLLHQNQNFCYSVVMLGLALRMAMEELLIPVKYIIYIVR